MLDALDDDDALHSGDDAVGLYGAVAHVNHLHPGNCHDDGRDDNAPRGGGRDDAHGFSRKIQSLSTPGPFVLDMFDVPFLVLPEIFPLPPDVCFPLDVVFALQLHV